MKVKCPQCMNEFEVDEAVKHQLDVQLEQQREKFKKEYLALKDQLEKEKAESEKVIGKKLLEAELRIKEQVQTDAEKAAKSRYEQAIDALNKKVAENNLEAAELIKQRNAANTARLEAEKEAQKKIGEELSRVYKEAKEKSDEENRIRLEEKELQLKQASEDLKRAMASAERGSQQIQGEALEQLVERDLKEECRFDEVESIKTGARGADIRQVIINSRGERSGIILWEIKNARWQEAWIEKFKEDIAAEKASVGVIVVQDLPEKFGDLGSISDRIFAIRPRMVKPLAVMLRSKITEIYEIGLSQQFSSEKIEAFYNYLTSGDFKSRITGVTETYKKLSDLHEKDKKATFKRWGEYQKQLDKMQLNAFTFIGELQGISNGEIGDLLEESPDDDTEEA